MRGWVAIGDWMWLEGSEKKDEEYSNWMLGPESRAWGTEASGDVEAWRVEVEGGL